MLFTRSAAATSPLATGDAHDPRAGACTQPHAHTRSWEYLALGGVSDADLLTGANWCQGRREIQLVDLDTRKVTEGGDDPELATDTTRPRRDPWVWGLYPEASLSKPHTDHVLHKAAIQ